MKEKTKFKTFKKKNVGLLLILPWRIGFYRSIVEIPV